ncbi:chaperonin 10-like protein [Gaertneriomyces semiglobifer]|nr:chaperonin 10-like protein [Gaertneriomyces semiglobifer]
MATFQAAAFSSYGGPANITLIPVPAIDPSSLPPTGVLIKVHAASINPIDWKRGEGQLKMLIRDTFPMRTGYDVSGVVEAVGATVTRFKVGDEVFGRVSESEMGTIAEYVVSTEEKLAVKPRSFSHAQAAGVPLTALTAYQVLQRSGFASRPDGSRKFFVPAGAGGVGQMAIQIAKQLFKAETVATTASPAKLEIVKKLGADVTVNYKEHDVTTELMDYDMVFDTTGEALKLLTILKEGGKLYSIATLPDGDEAANKMEGVGFLTRKLLDVLNLRLKWAAGRKGVEYKYVFMSPNGEQLAEIARLADAGTLQVNIDNVYPFTEAGVRDAFTRQKEGHATGKVIVQVIQ